MMMKRVCLGLLSAVVLCGSAFAYDNPFADVPMNHWAYDAVGQLASSGVVGGYPDGSFKGFAPATRYEMASVTARALAVIDLEKADRRDVAALRKLAAEFADELAALGVKTEKLDERLGRMEKDLGGWSLAGSLRMDAKFGDADQSAYGSNYVLDGKNEFDMNRYRIFLRKRIDENTTFTARLGSGNERARERVVGNESLNHGDAAVRFEQYYVTTKLPMT